VPKDMYQFKKILFGLSMEYEKIDVCLDNSMLFWKEHAKLNKCLKCGQSRFCQSCEQGCRQCDDINHT
jgi:hypothetical protein